MHEKFQKFWFAKLKEDMMEKNDKNKASCQYARQFVIDIYLSIAIDAGVTVVNVINIPKNNKMMNRYMTSHDPVHFPVLAVPCVVIVGFMCKSPSVTHVQLL